MRSLKTFAPVILIIGIVFVGCGDRFLPEPLKGASFGSRQTLNRMFINLFPNRERKTNPYQMTEEEIDGIDNPNQKDENRE
ncbi:MAG: hypothetical protein AAF889_04755 [Cyanobacteria bacterium P01_D01_bin.73]